MNTLTYQCCFCGNSIQSKQSNVTAIVVVANWGTQVEQEQQLFCHLECFKNTLASNVPLYVEEPEH